MVVRTDFTPHPLEWVKSVGEVGLPLHEQILVFVAESPRKSSEITEFLGMSRVYGNIARCLNALLDDKLIELTIPEKPRSRLQRYRVTRKGRQVAKLIAQSNRAAATLKDE
jgi:DNA-binding PadR family transcriptional regulator